MARKKLGIIVIVVALLSLAMAPESLACRRHYRVYRSRAAAYCYVPHARVANAAYYNHVSYYHHNHSTRNKVLTVLGPAALGAGIGALAGGGKGAGIGALAGGGAGAAYLLIRHHRHHRY